MSVITAIPRDLPLHNRNGHVLHTCNPFHSLADVVDLDDSEEKCRWLRTQIIGADAEFDSPFGRHLITYSDFTASGRFLWCVEKYLQKEVLPSYGNTHTVDSHVGLLTSRKVEDAASYIKHCLGAGPNDSLIFCGTGATAAIKRLQEVIGIAVPSILRDKVLGSAVPESERWVVFVGPYEHHSNLLSWRESLAEVVEIGLDSAGGVDVVALAQALQEPRFRGRPMLGSFSACSNITGVYTDTRAIAQLLHEHGAFACYDFASSGPYADIKMKSGRLDGYDAVFLSPHKFVGGPGSSGILVMSHRLYRLKGVAPSTSGGGTVRFVGHSMASEDTLYYDDVEEREDAGTPGIVQKIRTALAFAVKELMGHSLIQSRENLMASMSVERLARSEGVKVLGNPRLAHQPVVSFLVYPQLSVTAAAAATTSANKHLHCRFVTRLMNDLFGIQARGGCACAGPYGHSLLGITKERSKVMRAAVKMGYDGIKPGWTRVSFCYYSPASEIEFVTDAIEFIATYGHRFLHIYAFDWKSGDWDFIESGPNYNKVMKLVGNAQSIISSSGYGNAADHIHEKHRKYLETAKQIAVVLPDSPTNRPVPETIDPQLVTFMI